MDGQLKVEYQNLGSYLCDACVHQEHKTTKKFGKRKKGRIYKSAIREKGEWVVDGRRGVLKDSE